MVQHISLFTYFSVHFFLVQKCIPIGLVGAVAILRAKEAGLGEGRESR